MKVKNLLFTVSALFACSLLNSCVCRDMWNLCVPEESVDFYVKTADIVEGQYVYSNASGYYVQLKRRRLQDGRYAAYAFPVALSRKESKQGNFEAYEMVQIPASFAHYLMGENGSSSPAWLNPRPEYNISRLNRHGRIVRLPQMSVTREYALSFAASSGELTSNIAAYALLGWVVDVTDSAIGTTICTVAAPFMLLGSPSSLFVQDSTRRNKPDARRVYSYAVTGGDSPTDITSAPKPKQTSSTSNKSEPKETKPSSSTPVLLETPRKKSVISTETSGH